MPPTTQLPPAQLPPSAFQPGQVPPTPSKGGLTPGQLPTASQIPPIQFPPTPTKGTIDGSAGLTPGQVPPTPDKGGFLPPPAAKGGFGPANVDHGFVPPAPAKGRPPFALPPPTGTSFFPPSVAKGVYPAQPVATGVNATSADTSPTHTGAPGQPTNVQGDPTTAVGQVAPVDPLTPGQSPVTQLPPSPAKGGFLPPAVNKPFTPAVLPGQTPVSPNVSEFSCAGRAGHRFSERDVDSGDGLLRLVGGPFNRMGWNHNGFDCDGYRATAPNVGTDPWGYNTSGMDAGGADPWGFDQRGFDGSSKSISEWPNLGHFRSQYLSEPMGFRTRYEVGPSGEISELAGKRQVWPVNGEYHPYSRHDSPPSPSKSTIRVPPTLPLIGSSNDSSNGSSATPPPVNKVPPVVPMTTPAATPVTTPAATSSSSGDIPDGYLPVTIKGHPTNLDAGWTAMQDQRGRVYIRPAGGTPIPLAANIMPDEDFRMIETDGSWTFEQSR